MSRKNPVGWNRYQWAGERENVARALHEPDLAVARWSYPQWVGEGRGSVTHPARIDALGDSNRPSGFSGLGVSDSGGQRWAPRSAPVPAAVDESASEEEARAA